MRRKFSSCSMILKLSTPDALPKNRRTSPAKKGGKSQKMRFCTKSAEIGSRMHGQKMQRHSEGLGRSEKRERESTPAQSGRRERRPRERKRRSAARKSLNLEPSLSSTAGPTHPHAGPGASPSSSSPEAVAKKRMERRKNFSPLFLPLLPFERGRLSLKRNCFALPTSKAPFPSPPLLYSLYLLYSTTNTSRAVAGKAGGSPPPLWNTVLRKYPWNEPGKNPPSPSSPPSPSFPYILHPFPLAPPL